MKKSILLCFILSLIIASAAISQTTKLKEVGSRGWYTTVEPLAEFNPDDESVEIWSPQNREKFPIVIYAHGGAGFREDDRARVELLRKNGFATLSFDAYEMNGLDWNFVTRRVTNTGKQNLIWNVYKGAVDYALRKNEWKNHDIFLYGASNGGRTVLYAGAELANERIQGIISEAPAATGYPLGDVTIPTIIPFGQLDTWAGKSETDFIWTRTYPNSPISLEQWVNSQQAKGHSVQFIFYENAGHLLFEGPLEKVTVKRGNAIAFTAYQGADKKALMQYKNDVISFIQRNSVE